MDSLFLRTVVLIWVICSLSAHAQKPAIQIIYPRERQLITATDSVIVLGQVKVPFVEFSVNRQKITVDKDGAFIGFIPILDSLVNGDSSYVLECKVRTKDSEIVFNRKIFIPLPQKPFSPDTLALDTNEVFPREDVWLKYGDRLTLSCRGTPGARAFVSIIDSAGREIEKNIPLAETETGLMDNFGDGFYGQGKKSKRSAIPGVFTGTYLVKSGTNFKNARLRFILDRQGKKLAYFSQAKLSAYENASPVVAEITAEINNATVEPGRSYYYFLPKGIRAAVTGQIGLRVRLQLSENHDAWLAETNVHRLPEGTPLPVSTIPVVRVKNLGDKTEIKLFMSEKIPFQVVQSSEKQLQLKLFGGISDTDWIRFEKKGENVVDVMWSQPENDVYQLTVDLVKPHYWGYETRYDETNLIWTIHHAPPGGGLKGLKICIDPGHSADIGAVGPRGTHERQANVEVALKLKAILENEGATIVMTHLDTTANLTLNDRVRIANENDCRLFISLHHNAMPDDVNPLVAGFGPTVIYYHSQSRALAEYVQSAVIEKTKLPDFGIFQGNIAVCRNAEMPAILVECAFMALPDQEKLIRDEKFQKKIAEAIRDGLKKFLKKTR